MVRRIQKKLQFLTEEKMAYPKCSEEEFIALWEKLGSASAVAKALELNIRNVQLRRRNIENRLGIYLKSHSEKSPDFKITYPDNNVRTKAEISDTLGPGKKGW